MSILNLTLILAGIVMEASQITHTNAAHTEENYKGNAEAFPYLRCPAPRRRTETLQQQQTHVPFWVRDDRPVLVEPSAFGWSRKGAYPPSGLRSEKQGKRRRYGLQLYAASTTTNFKTTIIMLCSRQDQTYTNLES